MAIQYLTAVVTKVAIHICRCSSDRTYGDSVCHCSSERTLPCTFTQEVPVVIQYVTAVVTRLRLQAYQILLCRSLVNFSMVLLQPFVH